MKHLCHLEIKTIKTTELFFSPNYSLGCASARDPWCYSFSKISLEQHMSKLVNFYNKCALEGIIQTDSSNISWSRGLIDDCMKQKKHKYDPICIRKSLYRPFVKQHYYFNRSFNGMVYRMASLFPNPQLKNLRAFPPFAFLLESPCLLGKKRSRLASFWP